MHLKYVEQWDLGGGEPRFSGRVIADDDTEVVVDHVTQEELSVLLGQKRSQYEIAANGEIVRRKEAE